MNIVLVAGLLVATLLLQTCEARGAMIPEHPQTAFCKADFVVRVKILGKIKRDDETPAPEVVFGDSFNSLPAPEPTPDDVDESTKDPTKMVVKDSSTRRSFQKPSDFPPGEDGTEQPTESLLDSLLGRHRRSSVLGIRGVPPPPAASFYKPREQHRDKGMMYYDVLIKKVFKGGDKVRNSRGTFVDASNPKRFFARIYFSSYHGQDLEPGVAYMLSGKIMDNDLVLPSRGCWLEKWTDLSRDEVRGLHWKYAANCDCMINFCVQGRCRKMPPLECAWEVPWVHLREPTRDCGAKHNLCVKHQNECQWTTGRGFDSCSNPSGYIP